MAASLSVRVGNWSDLGVPGSLSLRSSFSPLQHLSPKSSFTWEFLLLPRLSPSTSCWLLAAICAQGAMKHTSTSFFNVVLLQPYGDGSLLLLAAGCSLPISFSATAIWQSLARDSDPYARNGLGIALLPIAYTIWFARNRQTFENNKPSLDNTTDVLSENLVLDFQS